MDDPGNGYLLDLEETALEALIETLYVAAYADGSFSDPERDHFARSVDQLTRGRLQGERFEQLLSQVVARYQTTSRAELIESLKQRLPTRDLRLIALVLASDMVAADGILHEAEHRLIIDLAQAFEIAEQAAQLLLNHSFEDESKSHGDVKAERPR